MGKAVPKEDLEEDKIKYGKEDILPIWLQEA
jgi:hypothetical protein